MKRYSSSVNNEIELLKKCLDALFENKIYEARKYIPLITQSFKNDAVARLFVPELVHRLTVYGGFLGQEQFDILVKLMNSAMVHESMAARLLPLSTAFYRVSTCVLPSCNVWLLIQSCGCTIFTNFKCYSPSIFSHKISQNWTYYSMA